MRLFYLIIILLISFKNVFSQSQDTIYYADGNVKAIGMLDSKGKKRGSWTYFYPSGIKSAEMTYSQEEVLNGIQYLFDEKGNLIAKEYWSNDLQQDTSSYFYSNGMKEKEGFFKDGLYEGKWFFYYPNGNLKRTGTYRQGLPDGKWKFYFENGKINQEGNLVGRKESGFWKYYDEQGNGTFEGCWKNGVKTGQWYTFKKGVKKKWKNFR